MDHSEIQKRVNELSKAMQNKGLREPTVSMKFECNKDVDVYLRWKDVTKPDHGYSSGEFKFFGGKTPEASFDAAAAFIESLPSADEARMKPTSWLCS